MASSHCPQRPSTPMQTAREDSVTPPDYKPNSSPSKMFSIQSLLNPSAPSNGHAMERRQPPENSPPVTSPSPASTKSTTVRSATSGTPSSAKGKKAIKDTVMFNRGPPAEGVNYLPFESSDPTICLIDNDREELMRQHRLFRIKPSEEDGEGQIRNFTRMIPYSSDKRNFFLKTGKEGFNVFQYTFRVPDDPAQTEYTVMWDYGNGLTRITPFFKACGHSKTVPAKALSTNPGLKELAHSITGGALAAQGYWVPHACARAICLTFCYHIRWALTPIFGPSFIRECLPPNHSGYQRFKIDSETVRCATLEAEGWKQTAANTGSPAEIPKSVPQASAETGGKDLRSRDNRTMFKDGSPFESDSSHGLDSDYERAVRSIADSPRVSPKTPAHEAFMTPMWTSINGGASSTTASLQSPLSLALLNQPRQYASWRAADDGTAAKTTTDRKASLRSHRKRETETLKRRLSSSDEAATADADYDDNASDAGSSSSESDDVDIVVSPKKKARRLVPKGEASVTKASQSPFGTPEPGKSVRFSIEDYRAARLLLALNQQDDHLTFGPNGPVNGQR